ncbi:hypothetical protein DFH09DRAFT_1304420 [Mycena vulgaris]|nr:hypothetical protein DFH09DRAFT_1304420 [Mycena vulgaris]
MHRTKAALRSSPRIMGARGSRAFAVTPRAGKVNCARPELLCSALPYLPRYHAADGVLVLGSGARVAFNSPRGKYFTHRVREDEPRDGSSCGVPMCPAPSRRKPRHSCPHVARCKPAHPLLDVRGLGMMIRTPGSSYSPLAIPHLVPAPHGAEGFFRSA